MSPMGLSAIGYYTSGRLSERHWTHKNNNQVEPYDDEEKGLNRQL
jgi:hypothetical protein